MLLRQLALNVAFVSATRLTQRMDPTGVSAAAYSIVNQIYSLGVVVMLALQGTAATLVPTALARAEGQDEAGEAASGVPGARRVADRLIGWSTLISLSLAAAQIVALPYLTPLFTPLPEVQAAVVQQAGIVALLQATNGPLFAGEGIMMGVGAFKELAALTSVGIGVMVAGLTLSSRLGLGVASVWWSLLGFHLVQLTGTMLHHLKFGPLARGRKEKGVNGAESVDASVECVGPLPVVGEVCVVEEEATSK